MAYPSKLFAVALVALLASSVVIGARKLESRASLATRLKLEEEEGSSCCREALLELQSCTGEVVIFFLNGETHLGANCCKAITVIHKQCWPSMLGTLGITSEESNVLRGFCDATAAAVAAPPPAASTATLDKCYTFPRL